MSAAKRRRQDGLTDDEITGLGVAEGSALAGLCIRYRQEIRDLKAAATDAVAIFEAEKDLIRQAAERDARNLAMALARARQRIAQLESQGASA